jgi:transcriptional regulator of acetoin/glycerol metabolism
VRELRNAVERMVVLSRSERLTVRDLPPAIRDTAAGGVALQPAKGGALSLDDAEKQMVLRALRNHGGNVTHAAADLGISRRTLHRKINEYGLRAGNDAKAGS